LTLASKVGELNEEEIAVLYFDVSFEVIHCDIENVFVDVVLNEMLTMAGYAALVACQLISLSRMRL